MTRTITVEHNGKTYAGTVMRIESTRLGIQDHGIVTASLSMKAGSTGVNVGGYCLDAPVKDAAGRFLRREGTGYGLDYVMQVLHTVGVDTWEQLKGREVIVLWSGNGGLGQMSLGIAHLTDESRVLILSEHAENWKAAHPEDVHA